MRSLEGPSPLKKDVVRTFGQSVGLLELLSQLKRVRETSLRRRDFCLCVSRVSGSLRYLVRLKFRR